MIRERYESVQESAAYEGSDAIVKPRASTVRDIETRIDEELDDSIDRDDLYILCQVGTEEDSLLTLFDYELICKRQGTDRCTCQEDQLYTL